MDEEMKLCWDKLNHVPMTQVEKEKEIERMLQTWYTMRTRRGNKRDVI